MVISQLASDDPVLRAKITDFMDEVTAGHWGQVRSTEEVKRYFDGLELLEVDGQEPVEVSTWRPDSDSAPRQRAGSEWIEYGGVALIK